MLNCIYNFLKKINYHNHCTKTTGNKKISFVQLIQGLFCYKFLFLSSIIPAVKYMLSRVIPVEDAKKVVDLMSSSG